MTALPAVTPCPQPCLCATLPPLLRDWIARQAALMGLPSPDNYLLLLVRLEKQRLALASAQQALESQFATLLPGEGLTDRTTPPVPAAESQHHP
jgi:hypothetical protein